MNKQTVNVDAVSKSIGLPAFATSDNGRTRWMLTKSTRNLIIGILRKYAGLNDTNDARKDHKAYEFGKTRKILTKLKTQYKFE